MARSMVTSCGAPSSTFRLITWQPQSLLSMFGLSMAQIPGALLHLKRGLDRPDVLILVLRGDFEPISFPLFHGVRRASSGFPNGPLGMLVSSVCRGRQHMSPSAGGHLQSGFGAFRTLLSERGRRTRRSLPRGCPIRRPELVSGRIDHRPSAARCLCSRPRESRRPPAL
jgi:hypothetical protein